MSASPGSNKFAAVTGATGAIGNAIAAQLAAQGYHVVLITRNPEKSSQAVAEIKKSTGNNNVHFEIADLSKRISIQSLAASWTGPLHILVNNAAISPPNRMETTEGIELQFATNVLGYFWMTEFFSPILIDSSPARVVNVASYWAGGLDLEDLEFKTRSYHNHDSYRQSKQANRMLTSVFAHNLERAVVTVNACHPGDVNSSLSNSLGFGGSQSPDEGAKTPVWLASSKSVHNITGKYFEHQNETHCPYGSDLLKAQQLYEICQSYT
ncbi:MAG: SDR family NAD(P)-dependent oxidoreductase [Anaerolineales bacterium]|nr:SDR family NAD(P)-dependent oxidoreductase [Anaerolineales bacterium]